MLFYQLGLEIIIRFKKRDKDNNNPTTTINNITEMNFSIQTDYYEVIVFVNIKLIFYI